MLGEDRGPGAIAGAEPEVFVGFCRSTPQKAGRLPADPAQPAAFVAVLERFDRGHRVLFAQDTSALARQPTGRAERYTFAEIDARSHVVIRFDRNRLRLIAGWLPQVSVTVSADVNGRDVEVPGYSIIGETRRHAGAEVRVPQANALICGLNDLIRGHGDSVASGNQIIGFIRNHQFRAAQRALESVLPAFLVSLRDFADSTHPVVRYAVSQSRHDARQVSAMARAVLDSVIPLLRDSLPSDTARASRLMEKLSATLVLMGNLASDIERESSYQLSGLDEEIYAAFKDTEIPVSRTGASVGDVITIRVTNDAVGDSLPRTLVLRLRVVNFGLSQHVDDSFFLLHRNGASPDERGRDGAALVTRAEAAAVQQDQTIELESNFAPAAGITYGWRIYPRSSSIVRFLHPGVGVNVSFPRFSRSVQHAPVRIDTLAGGVTKASASLTDEEQVEAFQASAGVVGMLFDGAVQLTYGWNLNVHDRRGYWGLGFSFVKLAERVQALAQDKGGS